jgi:hypothetical protein
LKLVAKFFEPLISARFFNPMDGRSEQFVEEKVSQRHCRRLSSKHQVTFKADLRASSGSLAAMVRLRAACGHDRFAAICERVGDQQLELACFVATARQAREIVALDPQLRSAELSRQARQCVQRRGQVRELDAPELVDGI